MPVWYSLRQRHSSSYSQWDTCPFLYWTIAQEHYTYKNVIWKKKICTCIILQHHTSATLSLAIHNNNIFINMLSFISTHACTCDNTSTFLVSVKLQVWLSSQYSWTYLYLIVHPYFLSVKDPLICFTRILVVSIPETSPIPLKASYRWR